MVERYTSRLQLSIRVLPLFFLLCGSLYAQGDNLGVAIIVGENDAWMIEAPEGWNLDQRAALAAGLGATFVPEGSFWSSSPVVMYANGIPKSTDTVTVASVIRNDSLKAISTDAGTIVKRSEPIGTIQGVDAEVCYIIRADSMLCEAIAYINGCSGIAIIVLSARNAGDFHNSLDAFSRLVDSYEWITSDPERIAELKRMR